MKWRDDTFGIGIWVEEFRVGVYCMAWRLGSLVEDQRCVDTMGLVSGTCASWNYCLFLR